MTRLVRNRWLVGCCMLLALAGCVPSRPFYFKDDGDLSHWNSVATELEEPAVDTDRIGDVEHALEPFTLRNGETREIWELSLEEAIQTALANSKVIRTLGSFGSPAGFSISSQSRSSIPQTLSRAVAVGAQSSGAATTYGPSMIETDPRFGTAATLSQFDAQLSTSIFWERNDRPQNFFITGFQQSVFQQDLGTQTTELSKRTGTGGQMFVRNHNNYELNNNPRNLFHGAYTADVEMEFRHPLLQGAGVQFNQIAGPNSISGFYNGVIIARIQHDQSLADLEANVRNLVSDTEQAYWRLGFCYRDLSAAKTGCDAALDLWRKIPGFLNPLDEARAREQYFNFRGQVENALSEVYSAENNLRYMMGIAATDGRLIRPCDEPTTAHVTFDWYDAHQEMLCRQPELRFQKWRIKESEMRLIAAKNFLLPRVDMVGRYRFRGFGEKLLDGPRGDTRDQIDPAQGGGQISRFNSAYQTLTQGDFQEWQLGVSAQFNLGFRREMAGVRNEQLRVARERAVLQEMELEMSHQLSEAIRTLEREYWVMQTSFNRLVGARNEVELLQSLVNAGASLGSNTSARSIDLYDRLFQALLRQTNDESTFYAALSRYNVAIAGVHFRKGTLLEYNGIQVAEGPWADKAYFDAYRHAKARDAGLMIDYGFTRPNLVSRGPVAQQTLPGVLPLRDIEPTLAPPPSDDGGPARLPNEESIPSPRPEPTAQSATEAATTTEPLLVAPRLSAVELPSAAGPVIPPAASEIARPTPDKADRSGGAWQEARRRSTGTATMR